MKQVCNSICQLLCLPTFMGVLLAGPPPHAEPARLPQPQPQGDAAALVPGEGHPHTLYTYVCRCLNQSVSASVYICLHVSWLHVYTVQCNCALVMCIRTHHMHTPLHTFAIEQKSTPVNNRRTQTEQTAGRQAPNPCATHSVSEVHAFFSNTMLPDHASSGTLTRLRFNMLCRCGCCQRARARARAQCVGGVPGAACRMEPAASRLDTSTDQA